MIMITIGTQTRTYTVADIRKVVDKFAADYLMISQSTGLLSTVAEDVADLKIFAEYGYLVQVTLYLLAKEGNKLRVAVYKVSEAATGWNSDRPGNNLWPRTTDGSLCVIAALTNSWWQKTEEGKATFIKDRGLHNAWARTRLDTSLVGLSSSTGQKYASNGYGWERTNYSK
jgi:hypothetical protein